MTIERKVFERGKLIDITHPAPGTSERLGSPISDSQVFRVHVDSDDDLTITYIDVWVEYSQIVSKEREKMPLSKHSINLHTIRSKPTFWRRTIIEYGWTPTQLLIDLDDELKIQALLEKGVYNEESAGAMRDQLLYQKHIGLGLIRGK